MLAFITMKGFFLLFLISLTSCQLIHESPARITPSKATVTNTVSYHVTQSITLINEGPLSPEKQNLWVALITEQAPYQQIISRDVRPDNYSTVTDEFGNLYAEFDLKDMDPGSSVEINIKYEISVNELVYDLTKCDGELPDIENQPELHVESNNPQIVALAAELSSPNQTVCEQVRSFYDYIGDNLVYTYNGNDWGAQAALGKMGADCTEYSSLLMALSRAKGIPARYIEGLLYMDEGNTLEAQQEHSWVELFFPGIGWTPVDPTLGRSPLTRESHFARYTPRHIIVTRGRNPSTLRGASYWSHLYWPGDSTTIRISDAYWTITPLDSIQSP